MYTRENIRKQNEQYVGKFLKADAKKLYAYVEKVDTDGELIGMSIIVWPESCKIVKGLVTIFSDSIETTKEEFAEKYSEALEQLRAVVLP